MPSWLKQLIDGLTTKATGVKGWMLKKLLEYGGKLLLEWWKEFQREQEQKKAAAKVQNDINTGAKRDEETRKNELDHLNS